MRPTSVITIDTKRYRVEDAVADFILQISKERDHYEGMVRKINDIIAADLNVHLGEIRGDRDADAPALLSACKSLVALWEDCWADHIDTLTLTQRRAIKASVEETRAAIAQAEGRE